MKFDLSKFESVRKIRKQDSEKQDSANINVSVCISELDRKFLKDYKLNLSKMAREIIRELRIMESNDTLLNDVSVLEDVAQWNLLRIWN